MAGRSWAERYFEERNLDRQEAYEQKRARARARRQRQTIKAHKRRQAGKIVHVRGYCRRGRSKAEPMPF